MSLEGCQSRRHSFRPSTAFQKGITMQELSAGRRSDEPIYNIGAVVRMVGIPEATLRAWERRYGFPMPARTDGSHRLYSEGQVRQLQWIKNQIDSGMQVRQAVQALHRAFELETKE